MSIKKNLIVLSILILGLLAVGMAAASSVLNVASPETITGKPALVPPMLVPPVSVDMYTEVAVNDIQSLDNRPIAYLADPPRELTNAYVYFPPLTNSTTEDVAFQILSSVQYEVAGQAILVTLSRPSSMARATQMSLGSETVQLANGITAFVSSNVGSAYANQVVFATDDLLVTLAGNLSTAELQTLASTVSIIEP